MNERSASIAPTRQLTWPLHAARVTFLLAALCAFATPAIFWLQGAIGLAAGGTAALTCIGASVLAFVASRRLAAAGQPVAATLLATTLRMALPLAMAVFLCVEGGLLFQAGAVIYLLGFYIAALVLDTWHAVAAVTTSPVRAGGHKHA
ncbi:MAG: hypothetical protein HYX69_08420 [Planctomycetia bacterium]|nr:hypothetical protein [Planctomycetia bacterium]